jgi:hypothetical protein
MAWVIWWELRNGRFFRRPGAAAFPPTRAKNPILYWGSIAAQALLAVAIVVVATVLVISN